MDRITAADFFDKQVKPRFPEWTPTKVLIEDWLGWLLPFDFDIAKQAIKQHRFANNFKSPILKDFYGLAKTLQHAKTSEQPQKKSDPILAYSLKRDCDGVVRKFYIPNPKEMVDPQIISGWAIKTAARLKKMYGVNWVIIRDWETG